MKILVVSAKNKTVFNFRGDLVKDMVACGNEVYVTGPDRQFVDDIMALGVTRFIEVPLVKDNTSIKGDLTYLWHLIGTMRDVKPNTVFSYNIKPVIYGSIAAGLTRVSNVYAMVTGLGRVYTTASAKVRVIRLITKILYKMAFTACDAVIFQNPDDVDELVTDHYLPAHKTVVVNGSGVNMERFHRAPMPERPVFLMVSRIIKEKGVLEFCEAARNLKRLHPEARCILLGGFDTSLGALKPEDLQPYVDDGSIELPGEVKDPVSFYEGCTTFVLPSYYREGLPRTVLEAMACGRPVITTDWVGCREPIDDGVNGILVPIRNSDALTKAMQELCDLRKAAEMGEQAYQTCASRYEVGIVNRQMRDVIGY